MKIILQNKVLAILIIILLKLCSDNNVYDGNYFCYNSNNKECFEFSHGESSDVRKNDLINCMNNYKSNLLKGNCPQFNIITICSEYFDEDGYNIWYYYKGHKAENAIIKNSSFDDLSNDEKLQIENIFGNSDWWQYNCDNFK